MNLTTCPEFTVVPGPNKWTEVEHHFKEIIPEIHDTFLSLYNDSVRYIDPLIKFAVYMKSDKMMFMEDLQYFSKLFNVELHVMIAINLYYELSSSCTTICSTINNKNVMFRTMDWPLDFLRKITFKMITPKYTAVTWFGCVGLFTACNTKHAVAINYRTTNTNGVMDMIGKVIGKALQAFQHAWPTSYLVRHIFDNDLSSEEAEKLLNESQLISPTYFTFCPLVGTPKVIQRFATPSGTVISEKTDHVCLCQTNIDAGAGDDVPNILWSLNRREFVSDYGKASYKNAEAMIKAFISFPVLNEDTLYNTVMMPEDGSITSYITVQRKVKRNRSQ